MGESDVHVNRDTELANGACSLEARLGQLLAEQRSLRERLEQTRTELDRINAEVLRTQEEYCTDEARDLEYRRCMQRLLGFDPYLDLAEIEEARKNPQSFADLLEELERMGQGESGVADG